jgi:hypothetical protein
MFSDEKISHLLHLILNGLQREGYVDFPDKDRATREGRRAFGDYFKKFDMASQAAKQRIFSQKNPPPEHSPQWETLYHKYYEEEIKRRGGGG